ncbi:MAG: extracellular solute-binding protein [Roseomonas sp.]|nr:extracellular solute-binding protein [Roseomonas sp.]
MLRSWKTAVLGVMLAGMALVFSPSPGRANDINWRQAQGTELRLLALRAWFTDHWRANLAEFEQLTGIKVIIEDYPEDPFRQKLAVEMAGKSKNVDVFTTGTMREGRQFANLGWYADLSPMIADASLTARSWDKDDFIAAVWKAHQFEGRQVAVPIQANVQLLYYRKDLFDAAGARPAPDAGGA